MCDAEYYLQILCGCLSPGSAVGQGLRPFVVYLPSCRGGRFYTTEQFMGIVRSIIYTSINGNWILEWMFPVVLLIHCLVCCSNVDVNWEGDYHLDRHLSYPWQ